MIRWKHPQATSHALNCVKPERPQNKYIKPFQFKSREQNGGQIDPRINVGGRPKVLTESLAKELNKKVKVCVGKREDGKEIIEEKLRAECVVKALVDNACSMKPHSVAAFRAICELVEPREAEERGMVDRDFTRLIAQIFMERKAKAIEV